LVRIVHVITGLGFGGAETSLCSLIEENQERSEGLQHTVISILTGGPLKPRLEQAGANVIELSGARGFAGILSLRKLGLAISQANPDIVHAWMYHANAATAVLRRLNFFRSKLIWSVRQSIDNPALDHRLTRAIIKFGAWISKHPDFTVYNSACSALTHVSQGYSPERYTIINNGVNCDRFRPRSDARSKLRAELGLASDATLVGRIARYAPMKDFETLISAFGRVRDSLPRAHLLLVGDNIEGNDELLSLCRESGILDRVTFMRSRLDIEMVYPALDVMVSSSRSNEGFPNVVAEALASGTLVAASSSGDGALIRGAHEVVPPQDSTALSAAIIKLGSLNEHERSLRASKGRQFVLDNFSQQRCYEKYVELYRRLATKHSVDGEYNSESHACSPVSP
jgi:glycosyltransferase involved in cell wall biosynthesis